MSNKQFNIIVAGWSIASILIGLFCIFIYTKLQEPVILLVALTSLLQAVNFYSIKKSKLVLLIIVPLLSLVASISYIVTCGGF